MISKSDRGGDRGVAIRLHNNVVHQRSDSGGQTKRSEVAASRAGHRPPQATSRVRPNSFAVSSPQHSLRSTHFAASDAAAGSTPSIQGPSSDW